MMKRSKRWVLLTVPSAILVTGIVIAGVFGWSYAKQTILLGREQVPQYQTSHYQSGTNPQSDAMVGVPDSKASTQSTTHLWNPMPKDGTQIGTISFPSIHLSVPVIQGSDSSDLSLGVGHVTTTALPGQGSNVFLAGHRDTVFRQLRYLKKGDKIVFSTPYGDFVYQATAFQVVPDTAVQFLAPTSEETLTLSTCYPFNYFGAAPERYIVFTKMVQEPKAALLGT